MSPNKTLPPPSRPLRLAILLADTPVPRANEKYSGYTGVFSHLLDQAVSPGPLASFFTISSYDVVNEPDKYPNLSDIDCVLITGSKHSACLEHEWILKLMEFTKSAIHYCGEENRRIKVVGVCFGHQIVGRAMGNKVQKSERGWEVSVLEVPLTDEGKRIFGMEQMRIHQMHRDEVVSFPPSSKPLAYTTLCPNQGMYVAGSYITVQGHPEFNHDIMSEILDIRHKLGVFADDMYEEAIGRAGNEQDGVQIAKAFVRFLMDSGM